MPEQSTESGSGVAELRAEVERLTTLNNRLYALHLSRDPEFHEELLKARETMESIPASEFREWAEGIVRATPPRPTLATQLVRVTQERDRLREALQVVATAFDSFPTLENPGTLLNVEDVVRHALQGGGGEQA